MEDYIKDYLNHISMDQKKYFSEFIRCEVCESEDDFNTYFAKRVERSGEDFARLLLGPPEKECFQTDDWGYGKEWQK